MLPNNRIKYLCLLSLIPIHMAGQENKDSIRSRHLDAVVITGARNETDVRHLSQTVSVINR